MTSPPPTSTKIRVRNYQSIADAKIEVSGLTVVTGKSNIGKSALIRAATAMLFGAPGESFIKNGEAWAGGAIVIEDGQGEFKVQWRKVKTQARTPNLQPVLAINGHVHTKIGRDHKDLVAPYGIAEIETTTARFRPQVAGQFDQIFLIGANETAVAEVFKILGRADIVTDAQKEAKKDLKENTDRKAIRREDTETQRARVKELDHVPALRSQLIDLQRETAELKTQIEQSYKRMGEIEEYERLLSLLRPLPEPPPLPSPPQNSQAITLILELFTLHTRPLPAAVEFDHQTIPSLVELKALIEYSELTTKEQMIEQGLDLTLREMAVADTKRLELEAKLGICPTCQRAFQGDHVHV